MMPGICSPEGASAVAALEQLARTAHCHGPARAESPLTLPETGSDPATLQKALSAVPDAEYVHVALAHVANPETPSEFMKVLFDNLANRSEEVKLLSYLVIAQNEANPMAQSAIDGLRATLGSDFQREWGRWEQAISQRIYRNKKAFRSDNCRMH